MVEDIKDWIYSLGCMEFGFRVQRRSDTVSVSTRVGAGSSSRLHPMSQSVLDSITTSWQKCEVVPRWARIEGSWTVVSLNSRLESKKEGEELPPAELCPLHRSVTVQCIPVKFITGPCHNFVGTVKALELHG